MTTMNEGRRQMNRKEAIDAVHKLLDEVKRLTTIPPAYPDCTSAVLAMLDHDDGQTVLRVMHANEDRNKALEDLIGTIWLYVESDYLCSQMTSEQRELWDEVVNRVESEQP